MKTVWPFEVVNFKVSWIVGSVILERKCNLSPPRSADDPHGKKKGLSSADKRVLKLSNSITRNTFNLMTHMSRMNIETSVENPKGSLWAAQLDQNQCCFNKLVIAKGAPFYRVKKKEEIREKREERREKTKPVEGHYCSIWTGRFGQSCVKA